MHKLGENNPNVMLIDNGRLFYNGLLGNSGRIRQLGAFTIYAASEGRFSLSVENGPWRQHAIAAVPPYARHRLMAESDTITNICIEPETISQPALQALARMVAQGTDASALAARIRHAKEFIASVSDFSAFSTGDFDSLFLDRRLEKRQMDSRIQLALDQFRTKPDDHNLSAENCARSVDLSVSRFLHLFREQTGQQFRSYRMWKRARKFLDYANQDTKLTFLALDLGYPDSTHFSHSIQRVYGLKPRSLLAGSRKLTVFAGENYRRVIPQQPAMPRHGRQTPPGTQRINPAALAATGQG